MPACIDLDSVFGRQYRVTHEESYYVERGEGGRLHDPWLLTIPCRHGHIYPHGGDFLGASTDHRGPVAGRLASMTCVRLVQDGDDGVNVLFHVDDFEAVATVMKPKRRRQLTTDQRAERVERLRNYQFRPASHVADEDRRRDAAARADSQAV